MYYCLSAALLALNRFEEAITVLHKALAIDPQSVESRHNLGVALFDMNRPREALEQFVTAEALSVDKSGLQFSRGDGPSDAFGELRPGFELAGVALDGCLEHRE